MAPRRNNNSGHSVMDVQNLLGLDPDCLDTDTQSVLNTNNNHNMNSNHSNDSNMTRCCVPSGDCLKSCSVDFGLINLEDLRDCVRVICNNEGCLAGQYMHRECFDAWEQNVLSFLKSIGRARSWSDRQRQQNLWTKKGYDLVFKACGCKCGRGHLKKDLDWTPPTTSTNIFGRLDDDSAKKKKKRSRNNQKPTLAISTSANVYHPNSNVVCSSVINGLLGSSELRGRAGSLSSSNGSTSPPASASSEQSISPVHNGAGRKQQKSKIEVYSDRVR